MIYNVHERRLPVPIHRVAPLLDRLGGPDDRLWPSPAWWPMRLDGPPVAGAAGGHGAVRYRVVDAQPGRSITFGFDPEMRLRGTHTLTVDPEGPDHTLLRHEIAAEAHGSARLWWPVLVRPLHDALLEDLLDRAEGLLGTGPVRRARWSPWVRVLRGRLLPRAHSVAVPDTRLLRGALTRVDWADAHAIKVLPGAETDPQVWADAIFRDPPRWVATLMGLREALVGLVGIARGDESSFATLAVADDELLLGTDEQHLNFRASVRRERDRVVLSTVVRLNNGRGRAYFAPVRQLHPVIIRGMLNRAANRLAARTVPGSVLFRAAG